MKNIIVPLMFFFLFIMGHCQKDSANCHYTYSFINASNSIVYLSESLNYPSLQIVNPDPTKSPEYNMVGISETKRIRLSTLDCIESVYQYRIPSDTLLLFVFKKQTFETHSWEEIKNQSLYDTVFKLSLEDFRARNFSIEY